MKDYIILHQNGQPIAIFVNSITDIRGYKVRVNRANYFEYTVDENFDTIMKIVDEAKHRNEKRGGYCD